MLKEILESASKPIWKEVGRAALKKAAESLVSEGIKATVEILKRRKIRSDEYLFAQWKKEQKNDDKESGKQKAESDDDAEEAAESDESAEDTDEPTDEEPADDEPADDEPADDEPADDEPADGAPVDDTPVDDAPDEEE